MVSLKTKEDIEKLIDGKIKESITLDYKSELGENRKIAKDISAFANTLGGTIIYGIIEKDDLPFSINWIDSKGIRERIENVLTSHVQPKLEKYEIFSIEDPSDASKAIFIVCVAKSVNAPHMANNRYYKRYQFKSEPMEDYEIKEVIFNSGLREALVFEVTSNLDLIDKTLVLIEKIYKYLPRQRKPTVFIPFYTETWRLVISSGFLPLLKERTKQFIAAYSIIHEINNLIDCQKYGLDVVVTPSYEKTLPDHGTYIHAIIQAKMQELRIVLLELWEYLTNT